MLLRVPSLTNPEIEHDDDDSLTGEGKKSNAPDGIPPSFSGTVADLTWPVGSITYLFQGRGEVDAKDTSVLETDTTAFSGLVTGIALLNLDNFELP